VVPPVGTHPTPLPYPDRRHFRAQLKTVHSTCRRSFRSCENR